MDSWSLRPTYKKRGMSTFPYSKFPCLALTIRDLMFCRARCRPCVRYRLGKILATYTWPTACSTKPINTICIVHVYIVLYTVQHIAHMGSTIHGMVHSHLGKGQAAMYTHGIWSTSMQRLSIVLPGVVYTTPGNAVCITLRIVPRSFTQYLF